MKTNKLIVGILAITAALAVHGQAQSCLTNGLVAFFPLNGNANDASGNGNNGYAENTYLTTNQFGQPNSALGFAGNSWVYIPYSASMATTNFSVSLVFNSQSNFTNICILRSGAGASPSDFCNGYELSTVDFNQQFGFIDMDGVFNSFYDGFSPYQYCSAPCVTPIANWQTNHWYNLTFTQGTNAELYLNGVLVSSVTNGLPYAPSQSSPFYIGSNSSGTSDPTATPSGFFTGIICDVRFYNRALSANEVAQLYALESPPIVNIQKAVYITSNNLWTGSNYQIQVSSDLMNWTNQGAVFTATNSSWQSTNYWNVSDWNQLFFRLQLVQ